MTTELRQRSSRKKKKDEEEEEEEKIVQEQEEDVEQDSDKEVREEEKDALVEPSTKAKNSKAGTRPRMDDEPQLSKTSKILYYSYYFKNLFLFALFFLITVEYTIAIVRMILILVVFTLLHGWVTKYPYKKRKKS